MPYDHPGFAAFAFRRNGSAARCAPSTLALALLGVPLILSCSGGGGGVSGAVVPAALRFVTQPQATTAGQTFSVAVELDGSGGARATGSSDAITISATGGATIVGQTTTNAASGVASFSLSITSAGTVQLSASGAGLTATSASFTVAAAAVSATQSQVQTTPSAVVAGSAATMAFTFKDAYGNPESSASVAFSTSWPASTFTPNAGTTSSSGTISTQFVTTSPGAPAITATVGGVAATFPSFSVGAAGKICISPSNVDFQNVGLGLTAPTQIVTISNCGTSGTLAGTAAVTGAQTAGSFPLASGGGAFSLAPGQSQPIGVQFAPTAAGNFTAALSVTHNGTNAASPLSVALTGIGDPCLQSAPPVAGALITGTLTAACLIGTYPGAIYPFNLVGTNLPPLTISVTSSAFAPWIYVIRNPQQNGSEINWPSSIPGNVTATWALPAGSYEFVILSRNGATGSYSLTGNVLNGDPGCVVEGVVVSVASSGSLGTSSCTYATTNWYFNQFETYSTLPCTISLTAPAFTALLSLRDTSGAQVGYILAPTVGGVAQTSLAQCTSPNGSALTIQATSSVAGATGGYTLTVSFQGQAAAAASRRAPALPANGPSARLTRPQAPPSAAGGAPRPEPPTA